MNWPVSYTKGCMYSNEVHAGLYWYIIWCTSCFSFSLVGWLLLLLVVAVSFLLLLFQFSLETKVIEPWARSGSNWSNAQLPQLHWATVEIWVVFVLLIGAGVCLDIFCVSSRQLDFTNFSSNNMEFIMRSFRSKKTTTATWRHHEKSPASPCFLRYRVATAMLGTSVVASLGWHGEIRIDFFPFGTSVKYFWANLRLYKLHLFQSFPPS